MHKGVILLIWWLLAANTAFAQADSLPPATNNEWYIKLGMLSPFDVDGGIGLSGEYRLHRTRLGFQLEAQPILFSICNSSDGNGVPLPDNTLESAMPFGIKLRPEVRYYFKNRPSKKNSKLSVKLSSLKPRRKKSDFRTYVAVNFLYKITHTERRGNLNISNGGPFPAYLQTAVYTDVKKVTGLDVRFGSVSPVFKGERWFVEIYMGLGVRYKKLSFKDLPVGASLPERGINNRFDFNQSRTTPTGIAQQGISLPIGIKLSFRL